MLFLWQAVVTCAVYVADGFSTFTCAVYVAGCFTCAVCVADCFTCAVCVADCFTCAVYVAGYFSQIPAMGAIRARVQVILSVCLSFTLKHRFGNQPYG